MSLDEDALNAALSTRHISHSRTGTRCRGHHNNTSSSSDSSVFDPLRTLGSYEVQLGGGGSRKRAKLRARAKKHDDGDDAGRSSWLEIHGLTEGGEGLVGSFQFENVDASGRVGRVEGVCVLAGSRRGLIEIVDGMDGTAAAEEEEEEQESHTDDDDDDDDEDEDENDDDNGRWDSEMEGARQDRFAGFEKNSFRNPKFWIRWRGYTGQPNADISISISPDHSSKFVVEVEVNQGYIVFSTNDAGKFTGTISCQRFGWENLKMTGWKTRSRGTPPSLRWSDVV